MNSLLVFGALILTACAVWFLYLYRSVPVERLRGTFQYTPPDCAYTVETGLGAVLCPLLRLPGFVPLLLHTHEDNRFFHHHGFNWPEIRRRVGIFLRGEDKLRGGSSITQQLAKNILHPGSVGRGFAGALRKVREAVYTVRLEREFSKDELLTLYLNTVRWGEGRIHGIQSAARYYFDKDAEAIDLYEALFLVNLLPAAPRIGRAFRAGKDNAFPYLDAFAGCRYFFHWCVMRWGWASILDPRRVSCAEALAALRDDPDPRESMSAEFYLAVELCALEAVTRLAGISARVIAREAKVGN